jgi:hypothetical protein
MHITARFNKTGYFVPPITHVSDQITNNLTHGASVANFLPIKTSPHWRAQTLQRWLVLNKESGLEGSNAYFLASIFFLDFCLESLLEASPLPLGIAPDSQLQPPYCDCPVARGFQCERNGWHSSSSTVEGRREVYCDQYSHPRNLGK